MRPPAFSMDFIVVSLVYNHAKTFWLRLSIVDTEIDHVVFSFVFANTSQAIDLSKQII